MPDIVPSGLDRLGLIRIPQVETWGYSPWSLRDRIPLVNGVGRFCDDYPS